MSKFVFEELPDHLQWDYLGGSYPSAKLYLARVKYASVISGLGISRLNRISAVQHTAGMTSETLVQLGLFLNRTFIRGRRSKKLRRRWTVSYG
jgi:hypothetical protein